MRQLTYGRSPLREPGAGFPTQAVWSGGTMPFFMLWYPRSLLACGFVARDPYSLLWLPLLSPSQSSELGLVVGMHVKGD